MPQVDFTLEDVKRVIDERLEERFAAEHEHTNQRFTAEREHTRQLFIAEREHTRQMIKDSAEDVKQTIADEFLSFWDANLAPAFDDLHAELAEVKRDIKHHTRLLDRHSKDIMELRA